MANRMMDMERDITSAHEVHPATFLAPLGRAFFVAIFLLAGPGHFSHETIAYAAAKGVPSASVLVPLSGVLAITGGVSILLGYKARAGAWLLALFLVPVTLMMHDFWTIADPMMMRIQQAMFFKNISMLGAALLIAYHGAGPVSFDARLETHTDVK